MDSLDAVVRQRADGESRFVECSGFRLHYKVFGSGRPPFVVLLHGSFLSLRSWRHVTAPLADEATVVALDRPAWGLTSRPLPRKGSQVGYSAEAQADVVAACLKTLDIEEAVLVGNSTGGTIAMLAALRHPGLASKLVLVDAMILSAYAASGIPSPIKPLMKAMGPAFALLMRLLITKLYDKNIRGFWHDPARLSDKELAAFRDDFMIGRWEKGFWEIFIETHHLHLEEQLGSLAMPVLVVSGEHDQTVKVEESRRLASLIPGASYRAIADSAHLPHEEQPERFLDVLIPFIRAPLKSCSADR